MISSFLWTIKPPRLATPFLEGGMVVLEPSSDGMIPRRLVYEVAKSVRLHYPKGLCEHQRNSMRRV